MNKEHVYSYNYLLQMYSNYRNRELTIAYSAKQNKYYMESGNFELAWA